MRQQIDQQFLEVMGRKRVIQTFIRQVESCSWKYPAAYSKTNTIVPLQVFKKSNFNFKLPPIKETKQFISNQNTSRKFHNERFSTQQNVHSQSISEDDRKVELLAPTEVKALENNPILQTVKDYEKKQNAKVKLLSMKKLSTQQKIQ